MKRLFSAPPDPGPLLWRLIHFGLAGALFLSLLFLGPVGFNTNLYDILPPSRSLGSAAEADKILGERSGRQVVILSSSDDFEEAREGAVRLFKEFAGADIFEAISLPADDTAAEFSGYLYDNRFFLADDVERKLLENGEAEEIAGDALAAAYGSFSLGPLNLEGDPFLLGNRIAERYLSLLLLSTSGLNPRDGVLAARADPAGDGEKWYVLLRGSLAAGSVSVDSEKSTVERIYAAVEKIRMEIPSLQFYYSGVPFHSYESSSRAKREISLISAVTAAIILLLFLRVFRSPLPVLFSVMAAGMSAALALTAALLVFREIHVMTFVFGTTLIGTCVDYSVHFFIQCKANSQDKTGKEVRSRIRKAMTMSFVSSCICFIALLFAPFPILKQFAVFSIAGLFSAFSTCLLLYPSLPLFSRRSHTETRRFNEQPQGKPCGIEDFSLKSSRMWGNTSPTPPAGSAPRGGVLNPKRATPLIKSLTETQGTQRNQKNFNSPTSIFRFATQRIQENIKFLTGFLTETQRKARSLLWALIPPCLRDLRASVRENSENSLRLRVRKFQKFSAKWKRIFLGIIAILALVVIGVRRDSLGIENDIRSLYTMSPAMAESERIAGTVLNRSSAGWYFIVGGADAEETLEHEEALLARLEEEKSLGAVLGTSVFIPSQKRQGETYEAMKALLPLAAAQYENLGFLPEDAAKAAEKYREGFAALEGAFITPASAPPYIGELVSNLWIGRAGDGFYSCVLPLSGGDESSLRAIAGEMDFVSFVNKTKDISEELDALTRTMLLLFLGAFVIIAALAGLVYSFRDTLKIAAVPLFISLVCIAALSLAGLKLGFFSAAALVLVFGLGLDYIFYMREGGKNGKAAFQAVLLSFLTTLLSFGALALSGFAPAHIFGLTVSAGLSAAFTAAMLLM